jgi:hypothetical protein
MMKESFHMMTKLSISRLDSNPGHNTLCQDQEELFYSADKSMSEAKQRQVYV